MSEEKTKKIWIAVGIVVAIFVVFLWPHTSVWDGKGEIDAFTYEESVKTYRLPATMTVTQKRHGWFGGKERIYSKIEGTWPNGGTLELEDCEVKDKVQSACTNQEGKKYGIEVIIIPEQPETEAYSSD
jgi:hypothetical protein